MKIRTLIMMLAAAGILSGCAAHAKIESEKTLNDFIAKMIYYPSLVSDLAAEENSGGLVKIDTAWMEGSILNLSFTHPEGSQYRFDLRYDGKWMKSMPPQMNLFFYSEITDPTSKLMTKTYRYETIQLLPPGTDKIYLRLKGVEGKFMVERK